MTHFIDKETEAQDYFAQVLQVAETKLYSGINIGKDLSDVPVVWNLPANAGDTGLIPDPGRFHLPQQSLPAAASSKACALEPVVQNMKIHCSEKPAHCNKQQPLAVTRETPHAAMKTQQSQKYIHKFWVAETSKARSGGWAGLSYC